ncbi:MAG: hypothetical protein ACP5HG_04885 [Anaerolineae bacterium]
MRRTLTAAQPFPMRFGLDDAGPESCRDLILRSEFEQFWPGSLRRYGVIHEH